MVGTGWCINEELFQAVFRGDGDEAAGILKEGSDVNARSVNGHSVIHSHQGFFS